MLVAVRKRRQGHQRGEVNLAGAATPSVLRPYRRQAHGESGSTVHTLTVRNNGSLVQFYEMLHDSESKTQTTRPTRLHLLLPETLEHVGEQLRRDSRAGVSNDESDHRAVALKRHFNAPAPRCEFDAIRYKVGDDLMKPQRIAFHTADIRVDPHSEDDAFLFGRSL